MSRPPPAGNWAIRWRDRQSAFGEILPLGAVAAAGGVHHAALHGAVPLDPGRHDPHQLILFSRGHRVKPVKTLAGRQCRCGRTSRTGTRAVRPFVHERWLPTGARG